MLTYTPPGQTFGDGVLTIAITLLILDIRVG